MTKKKDTGVTEVTDEEIGAFMRALFEDVEEVEEEDDVTVADDEPVPVPPVVAKQPAKATVTALPEPSRFTPEIVTRLLFSQQDQLRYIWAFCIDRSGHVYVQSSDGNMVDVALMLQAAIRVNAGLNGRPAAGAVA